MTREEMNMIGFEIVAYSGDARSTLLQALKEVRGGNFSNLDALLANADENINLAHKSQTQILTAEASGDTAGISARSRTRRMEPAHDGAVRASPVSVASGS